jgi:hypothetical protein
MRSEPRRSVVAPTANFDNHSRRNADHGRIGKYSAPVALTAGRGPIGQGAMRVMVDASALRGEAAGNAGGHLCLSV